MNIKISPIIEEFISKFCIKCADEDPSLYMDNHHYIVYKNQGYYLPETISFMSDEEELMHTLILNTFEL